MLATTFLCDQQQDFTNNTAHFGDLLDFQPCNLQKRKSCLLGSETLNTAMAESLAKQMGATNLR